MIDIRRRTLILGGVGLALGAATGGLVAVEAELLPGRARLRAGLGLTGANGKIPDVPPATVTARTHLSRARAREVNLITIAPAETPPGGLPVCVALHGRSGNATSFVGLGLPQFLTAAVRAGVPPFVLASVDGGDATYWHERTPGDDPMAMLLTELPGWLAARGFQGTPRAAIGVSMGGSGVLRYGRLRHGELAAVAAVSPALFPTWSDARTVGAYADEASWARHEPLRHLDEPIARRTGVWCGEDDPFHDPALRLAKVAAVAEFAPGLHTGGYWRRIMPDVLAFLGRSFG
ncbi:MAG: alpha/beta hydrolase-fold protein [Streptosporangiaceae bacterium]